MPVEDRYKDDGTLTTEDRKKFSLRTGGTATALPTVKPGMVPGDAMTDQDVIREVSGSRRGLVLAVAAIVVIAVVAVVAMMIRGRPRAPAPPPTPAASAIPAPPVEGAANKAAAASPARDPRPYHEAGTQDRGRSPQQQALRRLGQTRHPPQGHPPSKTALARRSGQPVAAGAVEPGGAGRAGLAAEHGQRFGDQVGVIGAGAEQPQFGG